MNSPPPYNPRETGSFEELHRWGMLHHPLWDALNHEADYHRLGPLEKMRFIAANLLLDNYRMRKELTQYAMTRGTIIFENPPAETACQP